MKFHLNGHSCVFLSQNGYSNEVSRLKKVDLQNFCIRVVYCNYYVELLKFYGLFTLLTVQFSEILQLPLTMFL